MTIQKEHYVRTSALETSLPSAEMDTTPSMRLCLQLLSEMITLSWMCISECSRVSKMMFFLK